jgi:uncharacterized glyoxalase superfamily protein PhnB
MAQLTPYLAVADARAAVDWYVAHLGAEVAVEPVVMPDGRVGHVELVLDDARWMMADEHPEIAVQAPDPARGNAVTLHLDVADADALAARAVAGGAVLDRGPEDTGVGRVAVLRDPFGHRWFLNAPLRDPERPVLRSPGTTWWGVALDAPDAQALAHFYARLLGWTVFTDTPEWATVARSEHAGHNLAFQTEKLYQRPAWPAAEGEPPMQMHLDIQVDDLEEAVAFAVSLGAELADFQPQDDVRVLLDPAGHPFCLYL